MVAIAQSLRVDDVDLSRLDLNIEQDIAWEELAQVTFELAERQSESEKEVSLSVCNAAEIQVLNEQYRAKDKVTDVLSFPPADLDIELPILGDVVICLQRAIEQAQEQGHSLKRELSFLFVHGLLHLLGYDHANKEDELVMFALQKKILNRLGIED